MVWQPIQMEIAAATIEIRQSAIQRRAKHGACAQIPT